MYGCKGLLMLSILLVIVASAAGDQIRLRAGAPRGRKLLPKEFTSPSFRGYPISSCLSQDGTQCAQPAADKFCQTQTPSCSKASDFTINDPSTGPTFTLGDNHVQSPGKLPALTRVVCECDSIQARFDTPMLDGTRVDFCLKAVQEGGTDCGQPAADAFCRRQGYGPSTSFLIDPDLSESTVFLGTEGQRHEATNKPSSFKYIECGAK